MKKGDLKLEKRSEVGGGRARRLLEQGLVPAVVYGRDMESTAAFVKKSDLLEFLRSHGRNSVFNTEFAEEHDLSVLVKDIQYDPVKKEVVHLDFQRISPDERVQVEIPVRIVGREQVEKAGSVVIHQLDSVRVECLPGDIPQHADADISGLGPGHSFTAGDFRLPRQVSLLSRPEEIILTVNGSERAAGAEERAPSEKIDD